MILLACLKMKHLFSQFKCCSQNIKFLEHFLDQLVIWICRTKLLLKFRPIFVPEDSKKEDEDKKEDPVPPIGFFAVYRYADKLDYLFLAIGVSLCLVQVVN